MYYLIVVKCDEGWCPASAVLTSADGTIKMIENLFQQVEDDDGRVVMGTTQYNLNHAAELLEKGVVCPWVSFGDVRRNTPYNASALKGIEADYGSADHNSRYMFTMPTDTRTVQKWLSLRNRVLQYKEQYSTIKHPITDVG